MRAILMLLLLAAVVFVVLIMTNVIDIRQTREGALPAVQVERGEMPEFEVDTADIDVGTERRTVEVPSIEVRGAGEAEDEEANASAEVER